MKIIKKFRKIITTYMLAVFLLYACDASSFVKSVFGIEDSSAQHTNNSNIVDSKEVLSNFRKIDNYTIATTALYKVLSIDVKKLYIKMGVNVDELSRKTIENLEIKKNKKDIYIRFKEPLLTGYIQYAFLEDECIQMENFSTSVQGLSNPISFYDNISPVITRINLTGRNSIRLNISEQISNVNISYFLFQNGFSEDALETNLVKSVNINTEDASKIDVVFKKNIPTGYYRYRLLEDNFMQDMDGNISKQESFSENTFIVSNYDVVAPTITSIQVYSTNALQLQMSEEITSFDISKFYPYFGVENSVLVINTPVSYAISSVDASLVVVYLKNIIYDSYFKYSFFVDLAKDAVGNMSDIGGESDVIYVKANVLSPLEDIIDSSSQIVAVVSDSGAFTNVEGLGLFPLEIEGDFLTLALRTSDIDYYKFLLEQGYNFKLKLYPKTDVYSNRQIINDMITITGFNEIDDIKNYSQAQYFDFIYLDEIKLNLDASKKTKTFGFRLKSIDYQEIKLTSLAAEATVDYSYLVHNDKYKILYNTNYVSNSIAYDNMNEVLDAIYPKSDTWKRSTVNLYGGYVHGRNERYYFGRKNYFNRDGPNDIQIGIDDKVERIKVVEEDTLRNTGKISFGDAEKRNTISIGTEYTPQFVDATGDIYLYYETLATLSFSFNTGVDIETLELGDSLKDSNLSNIYTYSTFGGRHILSPNVSINVLNDYIDDKGSILYAYKIICRNQVTNEIKIYNIHLISIYDYRFMSANGNVANEGLLGSKFITNRVLILPTLLDEFPDLFRVEMYPYNYRIYIYYKNKTPRKEIMFSNEEYSTDMLGLYNTQIDYQDYVETILNAHTDKDSSVRNIFVHTNNINLIRKELDSNINDVVNIKKNLINHSTRQEINEETYSIGTYHYEVFDISLRNDNVLVEYKPQKTMFDILGFSGVMNQVEHSPNNDMSFIKTLGVPDNVATEQEANNYINSKNKYDFYILNNFYIESRRADLLYVQQYKDESLYKHTQFDVRFQLYDVDYRDIDTNEELMFGSTNNTVFFSVDMSTYDTYNASILGERSSDFDSLNPIDMVK